MGASGRVLRLGAIEGIGPFALSRETPVPPGPGEILIRVEASSLNYHDYAVVTGLLGARDGVTPMSDGAGIVEAVGEDVTDFKPGDRVVSLFFPLWQDGDICPAYTKIVPGDRGQGFARDHVTAPASWFTPAPAGWTAAESATLPCAALTAWRALMVEARIKPGDWVLTQGTGGVSLFALQFAKAAGARVVATSSSDAKLERLRAMGADALVNYRETPEWSRAVVEATGGFGADAVVEIGGAGTLAQSIRAARVGGHIALIGVLAGYRGEVPTAEIMGRNIRLTGITVGSRTHQRAMIRALEASGIRPVIDRAFPLEQLADAFAWQASGAHFGKIVVDLAQGQEQDRPA
ncbi:alcohol dehydrogenase [Sphingobium jiangsuense]|uniref:NADPH:quinone reductase-like Zn-dependent oxidoreductase n=1 Tax=Sphingobium jiangsuense TaxID=870476 RepID=A0A7W6BGV0_9SPHN|nr:NAD(P)-dependent alcohol dehydrogenase [Sphingobium jiangsuense]MBB3925804.1 NADPH:quinone reductase-like Zn-dependent oxidoreductase [Sphingobium jiangsuense]GLT00972.1 alcohol dehydrogenase [Sphingobium jiangsuense]